MVVAISAFAVPAEAEERFVAGWDAAAGATLHRALRDDVDFRFVAVANDAPDAPAGGEFRSHSALYDVVHEEGTPAGRGGVLLINPFEVPEGADEEFLAAWDRARRDLAGRQGYLGTRLHRSTGPAHFRFVNLARWSSPLMFSRATATPEFRAAAAAIPFASHPALYTVAGG
jgi:heme-degrading monooxygenase HmoA